MTDLPPGITQVKFMYGFSSIWKGIVWWAMAVSGAMVFLSLEPGEFVRREDEMNLPDSFVSAVRRYGIDKNDIIFAATADFDVDYRFADSVVALTKEKLILAAWPYLEIS